MKMSFLLYIEVNVSKMKLKSDRAASETITKLKYSSYKVANFPSKDLSDSDK